MNHNCDFLRFYEPSQTRFQLYMFREIKKSYKANILQTKILKTGLKNYFFVKKKFKGNLNSACFLFYNSHCGMNIFFFPSLCLGKLSYFFFSWDQLPTFNPLQFQCHMKAFCISHFLWDTLAHFIAALSHLCR